MSTAQDRIKSLGAELWPGLNPGPDGRAPEWAQRIFNHWVNTGTWLHGGTVIVGVDDLRQMVLQQQEAMT